MTQIQIVRKIYTAFRQRDVPTILEQLDASIEWEYGAAPNDVPWLQPRMGKVEVGEFFTSLNALEFHTFVPKTFLGGQGIVVALVDLEVTVKETGRRITEEDEVHIWHFNESGQVIRFRHVADTHQHVMAYQG